MKKNRILIIEDDKSLVKIINQFLDKDKFEITLAIDADEGVKKALANKPDIIILDVLLPGKSGFECLRELKEKKVLVKTPVIMLSNLGQKEEIEKGLKLGATDYLVKADFSINEIVDKIIKIINKNK